MVTANQEEKVLKVWNINKGEPSLVSEMKIPGVACVLVFESFLYLVPEDSNSFMCYSFPGLQLKWKYTTDDSIMRVHTIHSLARA